MHRIVPDLLAKPKLKCALNATLVVLVLFMAFDIGYSQGIYLFILIVLYLSLTSFRRSISVCFETYMYVFSIYYNFIGSVGFEILLL